jgi:hypothetical protein
MHPAEFCWCDPRILRSLVVIDGELRHPACGLPVACEFPDYDDDHMEPDHHAATQIHVDYVVCERHLEHAVNNVAGRYS